MMQFPFAFKGEHRVSLAPWAVIQTSARWMENITTFTNYYKGKKTVKNQLYQIYTVPMKFYNYTSLCPETPL